MCASTHATIRTARHHAQQLGQARKHLCSKSAHPSQPQPVHKEPLPCNGGARAAVGPAVVEVGSARQGMEKNLLAIAFPALRPADISNSVHAAGLTVLQGGMEAPCLLSVVKPSGTLLSPSHGSLTALYHQQSQPPAPQPSSQGNRPASKGANKTGGQRHLRSAVGGVQAPCLGRRHAAGPRLHFPCLKFTTTMADAAARRGLWLLQPHLPCEAAHAVADAEKKQAGFVASAVPLTGVSS